MAIVVSADQLAPFEVLYFILILCIACSLHADVACGAPPQGPETCACLYSSQRCIPPPFASTALSERHNHVQILRMCFFRLSKERGAE